MQRVWWIGRCLWTRRLPEPINTRRTRPASQGDTSNYTNPVVEPPDHGIGRSRGGLSTKIHQLVDGNGLPLVTMITPGQSGDSPMLIPLLEQLRVGRPVGRPRTRPDAVRGDKAYSSRAIRSHLRGRGIKAVIPEPRDQQGHRTRRGSSGGRPVALDADDYRNRNVIERRFCHTKQWRGLATRYDKHAVLYRAAVLIHSTLAWARELATLRSDTAESALPMNRERSHTQRTGIACDMQGIRTLGLNAIADEERDG